MSQAQLVLIVPLGELGLGASQLPSFGGIGGGHPSTGPVYPPGHPSAGLPIQPGHPSHGLPGSPGHVAPPIVVPPNVIWPPQFSPGHPDQGLPPEFSGNRPTHPIQLPEGQPLPPGAAFVAVYTAEKGWSHAVVSGSGTKPVPPAQPK